MDLAVIIATHPSARSTRMMSQLLTCRGGVLLFTALKRTTFVVGAINRKATDLCLVHEDRREKR